MSQSPDSSNPTATAPAIAVTAAPPVLGGPPLDLKAHLAVAEDLVDALPWRVGGTATERKAAAGRMSALAHQVAAFLAGGWTLTEIGDALAEVPPPARRGKPDPAAQEQAWRSALKRAKKNRKTPTPDHTDAGTGAGAGRPELS